MICSTKHRKFNCSGGIHNGRSSQFIFLYGDDKAKLVEKMKPIYRILEENGFTILDHPKMQTLSSVLEMMQLSYKPFVKLVLGKIAYTQGFLRKMKFHSTAISILITLIQPFKKLQK